MSVFRMLKLDTIQKWKKVLLNKCLIVVVVVVLTVDAVHLPLSADHSCGWAGRQSDRSWPGHHLWPGLEPQHGHAGPRACVAHRSDSAGHHLQTSHLRHYRGENLPQVRRWGGVGGTVCVCRAEVRVLCRKFAPMPDWGKLWRHQRKLFLSSQTLLEFLSGRNCS